MKKKLLAFLAVVIVLDIVALGVIFFTKDEPQKAVGAPTGTNSETVVSTTQQELFSRLSFVAVGDNLIHDTVYEQAQARSSSGYDFSDAYERVAHLIEEPDVAILNQETHIST